ncbi:hypothetical protein KW799_02290 [Candidatus Parcubacteria bacterium]|nr:hypothetical protein [Candidatus Parcubacteria bacterium]
MLIKKPQVHIVSREVTLATGELVRAFFAVIVSEGSQEVRFLGMKPIEDAATAASEQTPILALESPKVSIFGELFIRSFFEGLSPYFSLDFLVNQLARAPSVR